MRIRPIARGDIDGLQQIAQETGVGFTSLPDNRDFLVGKIESATRAFEQQTPVDDRLYFFVLEDDERGELAGCCAIEAQVGREVLVVEGEHEGATATLADGTIAYGDVLVGADGYFAHGVPQLRRHCVEMPNAQDDA